MNENKIKFLNKKTLIISLIFLVFILIMTIIFVNIKNNKYNLKFKCVNQVNSGNLSINFSMNLLESKKYRKFVLQIFTDDLKSLDKESKKNFASILEINVLNQIDNNFNKNNNYINKIVDFKDDQIFVEIEFLVNEENEVDMYPVLNYSLYSNSYQDIIKKIEEGGYKCQEY